MSRKDGGSSTGQLIDYILRKDSKEKVNEKYVYFHNLLAKDRERILEEFRLAEEGRLYKGNNRVSVFHSVLSYGTHDRQLISDEVLYETARKYFELRCPNSIGIAAAHLEDDKEYHLHFALAAVDFEGRSIRIDRESFNQIKIEMQEWHHTRFPFLQHSTIDFKNPSKNIVSEKEFRVKERGKSDKQVLKEKLEQIFSQSKSRTEWQEKIKSAELEVYTRGKNSGIVHNGRNYRMHTLGYTEEKLAELDKIEKSLEEIKSIRGVSEKAREPKLEDKEIVVNFLKPELSQNIEPVIDEEQEIEKDENDIEINFYPRTSSFELEI
jgi:hypothetical protein